MTQRPDGSSKIGSSKIETLLDRASQAIDETWFLIEQSRRLRIRVKSSIQEYKEHNSIGRTVQLCPETGAIGAIRFSHPQPRTIEAEADAQLLVQAQRLIC